MDLCTLQLALVHCKQVQLHIGGECASSGIARSIAATLVPVPHCVRQLSSRSKLLSPESSLGKPCVLALVTKHFLPCRMPGAIWLWK